MIEIVTSSCTGIIVPDSPRKVNLYTPGLYFYLLNVENTSYPVIESKLMASGSLHSTEPSSLVTETH